MYQKLITSMSALDLVKALYFMGGTSLVFHEIVYITGDLAGRMSCLLFIWAYISLYVSAQLMIMYKYSFHANVFID